MHMRNEILIDAPAQRIFDYASATERWPGILPHYRYVRVIASDATHKTVEMAARRPLGHLRFGIPVRWRAEQIDDAALPQIFFRHLGGWTKGMRVHWRFVDSGGKTLVQIDHELRSPIAPIIAKFFIDPIATRTLQTMKRLCETA